MKGPDRVQQVWPQVQVPVHLISVNSTSSTFSHCAWARLKSWSRAWFMCAQARSAGSKRAQTRKWAAVSPFHSLWALPLWFFFSSCVSWRFSNNLVHAATYCIGLPPYASVLGDRTRSLMRKLTSEEKGRGGAIALGHGMKQSCLTWEEPKWTPICPCNERAGRYGAAQ